MLKLVSNKIRCKFCGDVIESFSRHDFKRCRCGKCATDGGTDYVRRAFATENPEDCFEDLSLYLDENGKLVDAAHAKHDDIPTDTVISRGDRTKTNPIDDTPPADLDISEVIEEAKVDEPLKEEKVTKRNENGNPVSGRYPYGKK